jgi:hypothetical protein
MVNIDFKCIKEMDINQLAEFLEKVWKAGFYTSKLKGTINNMPDFKAKLKKD